MRSVACLNQFSQTRSVEVNTGFMEDTMKKMFAKAAFAMAAAGMLMPVQSMAGTPTPVTQTAPTVTDVALTSGGTLNGAVVTSTGQPVANTEIQVLHEGRIVAATKTTEKGQYTVNGLRNGVHTVKAGQVSSTFRFWNENTAPPAAKKGAIITPSAQVVRGQLGTGSLVAFGVFGAALTTTVITSTDNDDKPSSP